MLRSIKQLHGDELRATDREIGHIKDFYFDDQNWAVRYVVVDTGSCSRDPWVLISRHVFANFDLDGVGRGMNLTRKQIENSPDFDRQYEFDYYRYCGWPNLLAGRPGCGGSVLSRLLHRPWMKDWTRPPTNLFSQTNVAMHTFAAHKR